MRERGFTLLEIMFAVALIGILSTLAVPNLLSFRDNLRVNSAVSEVTSLARVGRSGAMQTGQRYLLAIIYGSTATASDDAIALFANAPTSGVDMTTITMPMMVGSSTPPSGLVFVRQAEMAVNIGLGPVSGYPGAAFPFPWKTVPHSSQCTFCGGTGAVYFEPDGTITLTDGTAPGNQPLTKSGSIAISPEKDWTTGNTARIYAISFIQQTGATRVWP